MGTGLASFQRRLRALPEAVTRGLGADLVKGAEAILAAQVGLAPEDSGDLKASGKVTGPGQSTPPYSQPGGAFSVPENCAAVTFGGPDVRYPHLVEHGTQNAPAKPFFWPGFRLTREKAGAVVIAAMRAKIRGAK